MGKKKHLLLLGCILLSVAFPNRVRADYYENHVDRGDYCMQAKDVCITDAQRAAWLADGTLKEKLQEKSGVFANQFHPSDSTRYWSEYEGSYEVDIEALKDLELQDGKASEIVPVTFYLVQGEGTFITIQVEVIAPEQTRTDGKGAALTTPPDDNGKKDGKLNPDGNTENETGRRQAILSSSGSTHSGDTYGQVVKKEGRLFLIWLVMTILAMLGYGGSLYSDFKVLRKYKQKREEREGKE